MNRNDKPIGLLAVSCCLLLCLTTGYCKAATDGHGELRDQLAELLKGHDDKVELAWYVSMPLHTVDPAIHDFFKRLSQDQKRLRDELNAWAKQNHLNLKFKFSDDLAGKARKAMEDAQGDVLQKDNNADFQRDVLVMMDVDFAQQKALANVLLKVAPDDALRAYLNDSIKTHDAETHAVRDLLQRYKFQ